MGMCYSTVTRYSNGDLKVSMPEDGYTPNATLHARAMIEAGFPHEIVEVAFQHYPNEHRVEVYLYH